MENLRDALCWDENCSNPSCNLVHARSAGVSICGKHLTSELGLWGRRQRPPCDGSCGRPHPPARALEACISAALPAGSRLHARVHTPPSFGAAEAVVAVRSLHVAPSAVSPAEAEAALAAAAPVPLRVAIDCAYDGVMTETERKSLTTQCSIIHGLREQAEHRPHVALAICCGGAPLADGDVGVARAGVRDAGAGPSSLELLRAAGLETWKSVAWRSENAPLSLLSLAGVDAASVVYLSPDAPDVLDALRPSEVYVIGGLVDKPKIKGASCRRARELGVRCARLPLTEHLPPALAGRSSMLDALNLNAVFRLLMEWSRGRDWTAAITAALDGAQRHFGSSDGFIHQHGYWVGPKASDQHQHDASLSRGLLAFFQRERAATVVDLGCGTGSYVRHFQKKGTGLAATGLDGNPATPQLSVARSNTCFVCDLSVVQEVAEPADWVMSLEVGEHLPKAFEEAFIENLHRHNSRGIVLSWALEGQGGTGHVNERNNDYVKAKVCAKGYVCDAEAEAALRASARFSYFKKTVMVFRRIDAEGDEATAAAPPSRSSAPCWGGWESGDLASFDPVWRIDLSLHVFANGVLSLALLPVCTAEGAEFAAAADESADGDGGRPVEELLTVVVTSSPVKSNPSPRMLLECLASLDRHGGLGRCRKLVMCDGFKLRKRSQPKVGVINDEEAARYTEYVAAVAGLCRGGDAAFARTRVVRLARRQGSAYAIKEAVHAHVTTPLVLIVPHDCVIAREIALAPLLRTMAARTDALRYVKLVGQSTLHYADACASQHGVRLTPTDAFGDVGRGLSLTPMLRYMDNVAIVSVDFLERTVFAPGSGVHRGTFIEDTYGKQTQMHAWLNSAAFVEKRPPPTGCYLLTDAEGAPMMRHLDGKSYLDPEQREARGLPPYPTDWTAALADR